MAGPDRRDTDVAMQRQIGQWQLGEKLGEGRNGKVYRVEHMETGASAALKAINARKVSKEPYQRFIVEIKTLRQLGDYPGILPVIDDHIPDAPTESDQPWLVMPIARPLRDALADADLPAIVAAIGEIAMTLACLRAEHRLAHRDLKPANLYSLDEKAAVGDFGLVALPDRVGLTEEGRPLGPVNFMPFEMLNDPGNADAFAADVYSLAKTLWTLACDGNIPPPGHQPASAAPHRIADYRPHPKAALLDDLVDRATLLDPGSRPSMEELAADLDVWASIQPDQAAFDMNEAASAVRSALSKEIGTTERIERWKEAAYKAVRRFDELARPLNEAMKAADPRADINVNDRFVQERLKLMGHMRSPTVLFHWTRASKIASGSPLPYVLRMGRGIELIEDGTLIVRAMLDLGMERLQRRILWTDERRAPVGSTQQESALQNITAELADQLKTGLLKFAEGAAAR
jgi:serine/threonine protein kinase